MEDVGISRSFTRLFSRNIASGIMKTDRNTREVIQMPQL